MKGKLIVIEGLDGSGKATQSKLLFDTISKLGKSVRKISFPEYDSQSSALIKMYLAGEFGGVLDVNAYAASTFYSVDRYASYVRKWRNDYQNGIIIADRYTTSNIVHQMTKLPRDEWEYYCSWIYNLEFNLLGLPSPDIVIYLDLSPDISKILLEKRYDGDVSKKDIHEADISYMNSCREAALYAAEKLRWIIIDCGIDGNIKPPETIAENIRTELMLQSSWGVML